jgi:sugar-specific transcriptional regulator TrmB
MYEKELEELGLSENETKIYIVLLEHGMLNPTEIAKKTGLRRTYIYDAVEGLLDRGIVNTVLLDNKKHFQAVDPAILRENFELKLRHLDEVLPKLSDLFKSAKEETTVELHRGKKVYSTLLKDLVSNIKKKDVVHLLGVDEEKLESAEPVYLKQYLNILREKNVRERIIIKKGGKKFKGPSLSYRELDEKFIGETTTVIFQSKVYIFIGGSPNYLIIIQSPRVAETYRRQFELLWKIAK